MPTGYTAAIKDGITLRQFVMSCSRAMGALVMMREEPSNAPIPERFEPSDYHATRLKEAQQSLAWYEHMAESETDREAAKDYDEQLARHQKRIADATYLRNKYHAMLAQVIEWQPPTPDHQGLKDFMIGQIRESIDFDCNIKFYSEPKRLSAAEWKQARIEQAAHDIDYHTKGYREEVERTESRNAWLRQLRASLAKVSA